MLSILKNGDFQAGMRESIHDQIADWVGISTKRVVTPGLWYR